MKLQTNRLHLRPVNLNDKEAMFVYRSDPETNRFLSLVPQSIDDVADFIGKTSKEFDIVSTWFQLVIIESESNTLIGDIGIHFLETEPENKQVEIGYTLNKSYRGLGFATEALTEVINQLFLTLNKHRIIASIDPTNTASIRLIERLGFRKEAHFVKSLYFQGQWVDDVVYAILAEEWKKQ